MRWRSDGKADVGMVAPFATAWPRVVFSLLLPMLGPIACAQSEAAREEAAMKAATPERLLADGSIHLTDADKAMAGIVVAPAVEGGLAEVTLRVGRVRTPAGAEYIVPSPVAGRLTGTSSARLGAEVKTGDELAQLQPTLGAADQISLGVQSAQLSGQIEGAQRELAQVQANAARAKELAAASIISTAKLQEAETAVVTTRSRLEGLLRAREVQGGGRGTMVILRAPADGTVVMLETNLGGVVQQGATVARILRSNSRWVDVSVPPEEPVGTSFEVQAGEQWIRATLLSSGAVAQDDGTRTDRLLVDEKAGAALLPGAAVAVRVARTPGNGIVLPETALVPGAGSDAVYVETSAGVFAPRLVRVAARFNGSCRLAGGVAVGEKVVVKGAMALRGESLRAQLRHQE